MERFMFDGCRVKPSIAELLLTPGREAAEAAALLRRAAADSKGPT